VLVPAMYRYLIHQICSASYVYHGICKDLSVYEPLISSEVEFSYATTLNMIWHTHNPDLLFHELPPLLFVLSPPLLLSVLTHPCSNSVTKHSDKYLECATFYFRSFQHYVLYPWTSAYEFSTKEISNYGLLMDFIYTTATETNSKERISSGTWFSIEQSQELHSPFDNLYLPEAVFKDHLLQYRSSFTPSGIDYDRFIVLLADENDRRLLSFGYKAVTKTEMLAEMKSRIDQVIFKVFEKLKEAQEICVRSYSGILEYKEYSWWEVVDNVIMDYGFKTSRDICKEALAYLINEEERIESFEFLDSGEQLHQYLLVWMIRRRILQTCRGKIYRAYAICKNNLSEYDALIYAETKLDHPDQIPLNIIWHAHNQDLLFDEIPNLFPSWLSPFLRHPCSDRVKKDSPSREYVECARYYLEILGESVYQHPSNYEPDNYGFFMDNIFKIPSSGYIKANAITQVSDDTLFLLYTAQKQVMNIRDVLNCETEEELIDLLYDRSMRPLWHQILQPHLPREFTPENFEQYLTEQQKAHIIKAFIVPNEEERIQKLNEIITDIFQPKDFNGESQCLVCLSKLPRFMATPTCTCKYALCPDCAELTNAMRTKCLQDCENVSHKISYNK
jgi:hypothetical protein